MRRQKDLKIKYQGDENIPEFKKARTTSNCCVNELTTKRKTKSMFPTGDYNFHRNKRAVYPPGKARKQTLLYEENDGQCGTNPNECK